MRLGLTLILSFWGVSRDVERGLFTVGWLAALDSTVSEVYNCNQLINVAQTKVRQMALV